MFLFRIFTEKTQCVSLIRQSHARIFINTLYFINYWYLFIIFQEKDIPHDRSTLSQRVKNCKRMKMADLITLLTFIKRTTLQYLTFNTIKTKINYT